MFHIHSNFSLFHLIFFSNIYYIQCEKYQYVFQFEELEHGGFYVAVTHPPFVSVNYRIPKTKNISTVPFKKFFKVGNSVEMNSIYKIIHLQIIPMN